MAAPYHLLALCGNILFAARGSNIHSFTPELEHVSVWRYPANQENESSGLSPPPQAALEADGPPTKRRKMGVCQGEDQNGNDGADESQTRNSGVKLKGKGKEKDPGHQELPFVHGLTATTDGRHLVAITGSDKTIWVFEHDGQGKLKQLSQRMMPKRPCAVVMSLNGQDILSADKFGDVYSLPLIPSSPGGTRNGSAAASSSRSATPSTSAVFKPQANEFTVHTQRNLRALENQKLGLQTKASSEPSGPQFEYTLLLGHVSMLTAILVAKSPITNRPYIITADRDEHIRVSRGHPAHAHIIEHFCNGHDEFVSRLCIPPSRPEILISGGGDDELFVWNWTDEGRMLTRPNLHRHVQEIIPDATKVAVTRIAALSAPDESQPVVVFVACERVPALFQFELKGSVLRYQATIRTPGNPLDLVVMPSPSVGVVPNKLVVTVGPNSPWAEEGVSLIFLEKDSASGWHINSNFKRVLGYGDDGVKLEDLEKVLYTTESLRKTGDAE